ncbi:MAG: hemolysin family protein [Candidatus Komeilibacteria bacterium]|nr:hemolysin family protein [Candidatus Komeilibacteria bacterium]
MVWIIFIVLLFLSGFFSAAEIAFFTLRPAEVKNMLHRREKQAHLIWLLKEKPQQLLITILIGNNVVNVLTASLATVLAIDYFGDAGIGIATGVATILVLIFGEITPKSLAQRRRKFFAQYSAPILYGLRILLWPLVWLLVRFNGLFIRRWSVESEKIVTEEEIKALTRLGVETGAIRYREREMIEKIFRLNDVPVGDIMTSRYRVIALNGDISVEQIAHFASQQGFSRYPVFVDQEDLIVGYVHSNDLMKALNSDRREDLVKDLARPLETVVEEDKIDKVFRYMVKSGEHMLQVCRAGTADYIGVVTLEDVVEEIVGEIKDETDVS